VGPDIDVPRSFETLRGDRTPVAIVLRDGDGGGAHAVALLARVASVRWGERYHAYGPAGDVPAQLAAVIVADDATRAQAWWNLWGNILHQGTVYGATVAALPVLLGLAGWRAYPDRAQAIAMLRQAGAAEGVYVWRYDGRGRIVSDDAEGRRLLATLRADLEAGAEPLLAGWRDEPASVQRELLWLLSVLPGLHSRHAPLVAEVLPARHRTAWDLETARASQSQDDADAVSALEDWIHAGGQA
jgi:hypothetical protein